MIDFLSDNVSPAHPDILRALAEANEDPAATSYGEDRWSRQLDEVYSELFETEVAVVPALTGTAANALSLSTIAGPLDAIYAHEDSHILQDECNAPEFFTGGSRIVPLQGPDAKVIASLLEHAVSVKVDVHRCFPRAVSVAQVTELGTLYSLDEIGAIGEVCGRHGLNLHMDGARFANAVAALDVSPADLTWKQGVDCLSFGGTKNGCLMAEAVILFRERSRRQELLRRSKRAGQLLPKMRFVSAQLLAYVRDGLWLECARTANEMTQLLATRLRDAGCPAEAQPEANMTYVPLGPAVRAALAKVGFDATRDGDAPVRLCTSWSTKREDIERLAALLTEAAAA